MRLEDYYLPWWPDVSKAEITRVTVSGCKSVVEERSIDVGSLTVLAGPNSSGKSTIMQPLLLLKQTLDAPFDPGPLLLDGPNVRLTSADQLLAKLPRQSQTPSFMVRLRATPDMSLSCTFERMPQRGFNISDTAWSIRGDTITLREGMTHQEIKNAASSAYMKRLLRFFGPPEKARYSVVRSRCFLGIAMLMQRDEVLLTPPGMGFESLVREVIHLPGLRGNPERAYRTSAIGPTFPGTFENYAASVIRSWQDAGHDNLANLEHYMGQLGLTDRVVARPIPDTQVEILVGRPPHGRRAGRKDLVNIADVGFGVSQALPVLVALLTARPHQLLYLEQPEIHLHPRAQTALAGVLVDQANRGVRVVAETHSAMLLLALQYLVAEGKIDPAKVKLHWFTRRPTDGVTEIATAQLDKNGAYGDWPEDFSDVLLKAQRRYLDAPG
jgi:energy-coupling factor transporter ATP-binding protein EcfA2